MYSGCKSGKQLVDAGPDVGIVIDGGNFWRGRTSETIDRTKRQIRLECLQRL